jgi:hypothetical protein
MVVHHPGSDANETEKRDEAIASNKVAQTVFI